MTRHSLVTAFAIAGALSCLIQADDPPREWIEPATGHRVVRLSDEPGTASLYFHQNPYTANGDKLIVTTPGGLATIDLQSRAITPLLSGRTAKLVVGRKTRRAFYVTDDTAYALDIDTRSVRAITTDPRLRSGSGFGLSADETLLAGSYVVGDTSLPAAPATAPSNPLLIPQAQEASLEARWAARRPMALYTLNVTSGELQTIYRSTDWLNHVQMSPTDSTNGQWIYLFRPMNGKLEVERLVDLAKHNYRLEPNVTFTPDGKRIVFRSNMHGDTHVYAVDVAKGSNPTR